MFNFYKSTILGFCIFTPILLFSQHLDFGYNTNYSSITSLQCLDTTYTVIDFIIGDKKRITKVFNQDQALIEELVLVDDSLVSGVEYFQNKEFPFLQSPRSFVTTELEHTVLDYDNIKLSPFLIEYFPKLKKGIFRVRLYNHKDREFFILNLGGTNKIYFK